jgi:hypothetical protein
MNVEQLIKVLSEMDKDKVVIITEPSGIGWTNVGTVEERECDIIIKQDGDGLFHDS